MIAVYFFAGILFVLLAAVLLAPLIEERRAAATALPADARLAEALEALREIEFEHETGKIDDAEYRELRSEYAREAIAARDAAAESGSTEASARIAPGACAVCEADVRAGARFCSRCGTAVTPVPPPDAGRADR